MLILTHTFAALYITLYTCIYTYYIILASLGVHLSSYVFNEDELLTVLHKN